jgi:hypothetical protein
VRGHHRVARVDAVGHGGDGLATGVEGVEAGLGPGRLGPLHVADVGVEAFEDAAADDDPGDEQDRPGGGDQPPVADAEAGDASQHGGLLRVGVRSPATLRTGPVLRIAREGQSRHPPAG